MGYTLDGKKRSLSSTDPLSGLSTPITTSPELNQKHFQVRRRSSLRQCITPTDLQEGNYVAVFDDDEKEPQGSSLRADNTPTNPSKHSRRTSLGHHRESLAGTYEESLLSGRMSSSTSKMVPFHASIGVLGKESCHRLLRCPKQISMSFNAGFVLWEDCSNTMSLVSATGSPYVGIVSLMDYYSSRFAERDKRKETPIVEPTRKKKIKTFPGYRIPPVGQLQIVVSNLQKTAVKLFLIPYNLSDMPCGTRTFIRQKVYSSSNTMGSKGTLLHASHLPVVRLDNAKLYLCGDVRLVFQNRVIPSAMISNGTDMGPEMASREAVDFTKHYLGLGRSKEHMIIEEMLGGWSKLVPDP